MSTSLFKSLQKIASISNIRHLVPKSENRYRSGLIPRLGGNASLNQHILLVTSGMNVKNTFQSQSEPDQFGRRGTHHGITTCPSFPPRSSLSPTFGGKTQLQAFSEVTVHGGNHTHTIIYNFILFFFLLTFSLTRRLCISFSSLSFYAYISSNLKYIYLEHGVLVYFVHCGTLSIYNGASPLILRTEGKAHFVLIFDAVM